MAYEQMASVYDHLMQDAPYEEWVNLTKSILKRETKPMQHIVDLGCGTGRITVELSDEGYDMTGVDVSEDMLSQADQLASGRQTNVRWICQDLLELNGLQQMDAAVSYCDVMNYITTKDDVRTVFQNTANLLRPDGLFVFDVHSMFHVENHCINQTFADVNEQTSYIWFCVEGDEPGEMYHDITFFSKRGRYYDKFCEVHHQQTFPIDVYKRLLTETGFEFCHLYGDFSLNEENMPETAERMFFVARKK